LENNFFIYFIFLFATLPLLGLGFTIGVVVFSIRFCKCCCQGKFNFENKGLKVPLIIMIVLVLIAFIPATVSGFIRIIHYFNPEEDFVRNYLFDIISTVFLILHLILLIITIIMEKKL
jgi:hypothetical protein